MIAIDALVVTTINNLVHTDTLQNQSREDDVVHSLSTAALPAIVVNTKES